MTEFETLESLADNLISKNQRVPFYMLLMEVEKLDYLWLLRKNWMAMNLVNFRIRG